MTHFYDVQITTDLDETVCLQIPAMSPAEAEEAAIYMVEHGVDIKSVNIGGMSFHEGKHQITGAVSVDDQDIESFKKLNEKGIELEIRKVDTDKKVMLKDVLK